MPSEPAGADPESVRLREDARREKNWKRWGPYLSERQWGTVREDYSPRRRRAGTTSRTTTPAAAPTAGARTACSGITDRECRLCFALALWNGRDPILKERLFGLTGPEGNHGEDVKECYYYLDATPDALLPQGALQVPAARVPLRRARRGEPRGAGKDEPEFELADTGVFDERPLLRRLRRVRQGRARRHPRSASPWSNRGPEAAPLHVLPTLWFRNTWCWGARRARATGRRPDASAQRPDAHPARARHRSGARLDAPASRRRRRRRAAVHRERDQRRAALRRAERAAVRQGRVPRLRRSTGRRDAVNPASEGTQGRASLPARAAAGRRGRSCLRLRRAARAPAARRSAPVRRDLRGAHRRGRRVLRARIAERDLGRRSGASSRQAYAGSSGRSSSTTTSSTTGSTAIPASRRRPPERKRGPQRRLAATSTAATSSPCPTSGSTPGSRPGTSRSTCSRSPASIPSSPRSSSCCCCASGTCTPTASSRPTSSRSRDVNPPVHAWACWRVYKMTAPARPARPAVPRARLPEAADQLHLVGEPQGRGGEQPLRRRLPRARQHRRLRPLASRCPAAATSSRPTARPGWRSSAPPCSSMALELAQRGPGLRGHRLQVLRALRGHRRRHEQPRRHGPLGRGGRLLLRPAACSTAGASRCASARWWGSSRCSRSRCLDEDDRHRAPAGLRASGCAGSSRTGRTSRATSRFMDRRERPGARRIGCWPSPRASGWCGCCATCSTRASSSPRTASARCRGVHASTPIELPVRRRRSTASTTCPGESTDRHVRRQLELARAGLVPVNYLLIEALERYHHFYGDDAQGGVPHRLGPYDDARRGRAASCAAGSPRSSCPTRTGGAPATATTRASRTTRTGGTWCSSTSTSTATTAAASAPATRPDGRRWCR